MSKIRYTPQFLAQLEALFVSCQYQVRYEKGDFQSGYCLVKSRRVVVVNKYLPLEGRINCLIEILRQVAWDTTALPEREQQFYQAICAASPPAI